MLHQTLHCKTLHACIVGGRAAVVAALRRKLEAGGTSCLLQVVAEGTDVSRTIDIVFVDCLKALTLEQTLLRLRDDPRTWYAPVVALIDADDTEVLRRAFELGVDDVLTLPLRGEEATARVQALLDGSRQKAPKFANPLDIDLSNHCLNHDGATYALGPVICQILHLFVRHPGKVLNRSFLANALVSSPLDSRTIDVYVGRLRRVLTTAGGAGSIKTVRGRGYRYEPPRERRRAAAGLPKAQVQRTGSLR